MFGSHFCEFLSSNVTGWLNKLDQEVFVSVAIPHSPMAGGLRKTVKHTNLKPSSFFVQSLSHLGQHRLNLRLAALLPANEQLQRVFQPRDADRVPLDGLFQLLAPVGEVVDVSAG